MLNKTLPGKKHVLGCTAVGSGAVSLVSALAAILLKRKLRHAGSASRARWFKAALALAIVSGALSAGATAGWGYSGRKLAGLDLSVPRDALLHELGECQSSNNLSIEDVKAALHAMGNEDLKGEQCWSRFTRNMAGGESREEHFVQALIHNPGVLGNILGVIDSNAEPNRQLALFLEKINGKLQSQEKQKIASQLREAAQRHQAKFEYFMRVAKRDGYFRENDVSVLDLIYSAR